MLGGTSSCITLMDGQDTKIYYNSCYKTSGGNGIYIDDSPFTYMKNNVFYINTTGTTEYAMSITNPGNLIQSDFNCYRTDKTSRQCIGVGGIGKTLAMWQAENPALDQSSTNDSPSFMSTSWTLSFIGLLDNNWQDPF